MALDENILGQQLYEAMKEEEPGNTKQIYLNLAKVIIEHIKQNGEVNVVVQTPTGSGTGTGKMS